MANSSSIRVVLDNQLVEEFEKHGLTAFGRS